jgi:hypothetical protein
VRRRRFREAIVSGQSNAMRELIAMRGERFSPNDCPKIPANDELLAALRREFGPDGRPDLVTIPHTAPSTPNR